MCLIGVKETYVQEKKKVTKNFLGQICTTVSGLNLLDKVRLRLGGNGTLNLLHNSAEGKNTMVLDKKAQLLQTQKCSV